MTAFKKSSLPTCRLLMCRCCDSSAASWWLWSRRVEGTLAISSLPTARGSSSKRLEMRLTMGEGARNSSTLSLNNSSHVNLMIFFSRPGYTSQHKQHQWQKTGHRVGKMCFLIFLQFKDSKEKVWTPILPETFSAVSEPFQLSSWFS